MPAAAPAAAPALAPSTPEPELGGSPELAPEFLRPRARAILAAREYALHRRHLDPFPPLFAFGDVVELELAPGPAAADGLPAARLGVPAVVVDVLDEHWLRLLVPARWAGTRDHHIFHVRTWNIALRPEWAAASRAELRDAVFGSFVLYVAVLASAAFEHDDVQRMWHATLKPHLSQDICFSGPWNQQFISCIDSAVVYSWDHGTD